MEERMTSSSDKQRRDVVASLSGKVTETGVFQDVLDGYDAVYQALPHSETFNRLWRTHAYHGDFPQEFAHIGFLTIAEAHRMSELLQIGADDVLVDLACGGGGPGLWMATQSGASLIGVDPSAAGLIAARARARDVGLAGSARFHQGTFEHADLTAAVADAVMSVEAFHYAPDKRAAMAEAARILRPGGRWVFITFEVEPAKVEAVPILGVDPVADYAPLLETGGLTIEAYEETAGWYERVNAAFSAIVDTADTLAAEMGERAAAAAVVEARLIVELQPFPRRVLVAVSRPC
jgi:SAM-dependent methyltransferase